MNAETYRVVHGTLFLLGLLLGKVSWQTKLQPLVDADVHEISEVEGGESEGKRRLSWIWKTLGVIGMEGNEELCDVLCIEWGKSRA